MSSNEQDRIRLVTAIGWEQGKGCWVNHRTKGWRADAPDPFKDASDDYAVLEWIRGIPEFIFPLRDAMFVVTQERLDKNRIENYCIGDYARAALKVIDEDAQQDCVAQIQRDQNT